MSAPLKLTALALCLSLAGCAEDKAIIITGESLAAAADTFVATATAMDAALDAHAVTPEAYGKWKSFAVKFQQSYPLAKRLWTIAADNHDASLQAQAGLVIAQLAVDLGAYASLVGVK